ncbi:MAG: hypothetical protein ABH871_07840 [Pseudomonadota bacterium]
MSNLQSLIFGLINFVILVALLRWSLGSAANQFFYSRRMRIRKQMLTSVMLLRQARARAAKSRESYEELPHDITARKETIESNCNKECETILEEAHKKTAHILEVGARQAEEERNRHVLLVRTRLLRAAFKIVDDKINESDIPSLQRHLMERGLRELSGVSITEDEVVRH